MKRAPLSFLASVLSGISQRQSSFAAAFSTRSHTVTEPFRRSRPSNPLSVTSILPNGGFWINTPSHYISSDPRMPSRTEKHLRSLQRTMMAAPKKGAVVDSYRTVSVNCSKCGKRLFRYKKKNGTKSNLVKCYVERISEDSAGILSQRKDDEAAGDETDSQWYCPSCNTRFARSALIHGRPALKIVGGKVRMTKK